jgi:hypothetical protein
MTVRRIDDDTSQTGLRHPRRVMRPNGFDSTLNCAGSGADEPAWLIFELRCDRG